jgi:uncharacterized protein
VTSHENRLIHETSPYLLQHAHNPVDWYPWGPEALERAQREDKPILLSIGYAACHWCHVMERESFENEATAKLMNESFVCVKVDREERPDLDEIYMAATVAMSGSGGWPMTVFLTPAEQRPFFAGTYFPPDNRHGRPGFPTLLGRIAQLWKEDRKVLLEQAGELASELAERAAADRPLAFGESAIDAAVQQFARSFDPTYGGFSGAPKFPPATSLELLLRVHRRTGDKQALVMVRRTLDGMAKGGMYDHLAGGFARYSTDERWLVPHFEKMLYDNALLVRAYAHAWQVMRHPDDERVVRETLDYVLREMTSPEGAFYSATDADSEGVEGKFFVWTPDEVEAVLPPDQARAFCAYYDVTPEGNWEGHSILHTPRPALEVATELRMSEAELADKLGPARKKMLAARAERVPPLLDDKVLTGWNALMIGALAEAGRIFAEPRYKAAAARAADFLLTRMRRPDGGLFRTTRGARTHLEGYLEDYAYLTDALVDVYEAGCGARYLAEAAALCERMLRDFEDTTSGGFFATAHGHEKLLVRMREGQDGAIPAANALAAQALVRLSWHLGKPAYRDLAAKALFTHGKVIERAPRAFAASLCVADMLLEGPVEAVLVGEAGPLADELGRHFLPNRAIVFKGTGASLAPAELLDGKDLDGALYLCRAFACQRPVTTPAEVAALLESEQTAAVGARVRRLGARVEGRATREGTARYAARFAAALGPDATAELGTTGLSAARVGFGSYRVDDTGPGFAEALSRALERGCNLVDTSTNYGNGGSERLIGSVLGDLLGKGALARDEVIVVSKIGYVQGQNLALAMERREAGKPFAEMVEYQEGCWHCIHPEFLEDQLERSLERLGLETLDVCLLHNPEYFLADAAQQHGSVDAAARDAFYARIEAAFRWFEAQVKAGRIGCYGVSSNTIAADPSKDAEATELARMLEAARRAGGDGHHFRVLQLPLNLIESAPALAPRASGVTVLELAAKNGLATLANRPLNAITGAGMLRLADTPAPKAGGDLDAQLERLRAHEERLPFRLAGGENPFRLADELARVATMIETPDHFEQIARGQILPHVGRLFATIERQLGDARGGWAEWRSGYIQELEATLQLMQGESAARANVRATAVAEVLDRELPLARHKEPLQRKALWTLLSTPNVTVVLLGMRKSGYVEDALAVMSWPRFGRALDVLRAFEGFAPA